MALITVGIPFFNASETILPAVKSVFAQTYSNWELILIDDGSTDDSMEKLSGLTGDRIRVISDRRNQGIGVRLNQITRESEGDFIARMDADDLMHPERIARQLRYLKENKSVDVVGTAIYSIDRNNQVHGKRAVQGNGGNPDDVLKGLIFIHPTIMGRKEWFENFPYDPDFTITEDRELWCRSFRDSTFAAIEAPLYFYREVGLFDYGRYKKACSELKRLMLKYGPDLVGKTRTHYLNLIIDLKRLIFRITETLGFSDVIVRRRLDRLSNEELREAEEIIDSIDKLELPV